jgi:hypothetical protein
MRRGDEVWDWGYHAKEEDGRNTASHGWCLVRDGKIIKSICWSYT